MATRTRIAAPIALLLALAMAPTLSGCFGGNPVESIIEGATGGEVDLGGTSIPEGFPEADVPLIDGEILFGAGLGSGADKVYNVSIRVSDGTAIEQIRTELEAAGFVSQADIGDSSAGGTFVGTTDTWGVLAVVADDGSNGWVANYTVSPANAG